MNTRTVELPLQAQLARRAVAVVRSDAVTGTVTFSQVSPDAPVRLAVNITGLEPGLHGFHVHQLGDTSGGCGSMGGHFNPVSSVQW